MFVDRLANIFRGVYTEYEQEKRAQAKSPKPLVLLGAEEGIWTLDPNLGKVNIGFI